MKFNKICLISSLLACFVSSLFGIDYGDNPPLKNQNLTGFFVEVDYLYLKPDFRLDWVVNLGVNFHSNTFSGKIDQFKYDWLSGCRVALGYQVPDDRFTIEADWTTFRSNDGKTATGSFSQAEQRGNFLLPAIGLTALNTFPGTLNCNSQIQFDQIDVLISRPYVVNQMLGFRPYFGFKALLITPKVTEHLMGVSTNGPSNQIIDEVFTAKMNYNAYGGTFGFQTFFDLIYDLNLVFDVGTSLLASWNKVYLNSQNIVVYYEPNTTLNTQFNELSFTFDGAIALEWSKSFFNCSELSLHLGWEWHTISNVNRIPNGLAEGATNIGVFSTLPSKPFTYQGLFVGLNFAI